MADVSSNLYNWSTTAASNNPAGSTTIGAGLDDNLREIQTVVRQDLAHKGADIASAGTTDLGAVVGLMHDITGTTTITGFGTVSAGIWKLIKFEGALTLTHNATSLILPNAANITTADGDTALLMSEGSGNWRVHSYAGKNSYFSTLTTSGAATVGGNLVASGTGPHAIGGATSATATLNLAGGQAVTGTDGATLRIAAASTGATNNYSLWVDGGKTRLDSDLILNGAAGTAILNLKDAGYRLGLNFERSGSTTQRAHIYIGDGTNNTTSDNAYFDLNNTSLDVVTDAGATTALSRRWHKATTGDNVWASFGTEATFTARGSIDYNRAGAAVRYNTTSHEFNDDGSLYKIVHGPAPVERSLRILRESQMWEYEMAEMPGEKIIGPVAERLRPFYEGAVGDNGGVDKTAWAWHHIIGWQHHDREISRLTAENVALRAEVAELRGRMQ